MAMFDFGKPLYTRLIPTDIGVDINKMYYVAFFNGNKLDTRPIKIIDVFKVGEKLVRQAMDWSFSEQVSDITNYGNHFLTLTDDTRNT